MLVSILKPLISPAVKRRVFHFASNKISQSAGPEYFFPLSIVINLCFSKDLSLGSLLECNPYTTPVS